VWCSDAGTFDMTANHTLPNYVNIYMPYATLISTLGRTLSASPVCDVTVNSCTMAIAFAGAPPGPGLVSLFTCARHTAPMTVAGSCRVGVRAASTASITASDTSLVMIEGGVHTLLLATMTSTIYALANSVVTLEASDTATIVADANVIAHVVSAAGTTARVRYTLNTTVSEGSRIHFMTPVSTAVIFNFGGGLTVAATPRASFVRDDLYVTISIPAFGGAQSSASQVVSGQVLPSPTYYPGAANSITGTVICFDGGVLCTGTFTLNATTNLISIAKDGAVDGKFTGVGDLWVGPMCFGYNVV
jgi:hypothetical protein